MARALRFACKQAPTGTLLGTIRLQGKLPQVWLTQFTFPVVCSLRWHCTCLPGPA